MNGLNTQKNEELSMSNEKKPFFARFLEQQKNQVKTGVTAGRPDQTMKYPSDNDEY